jgi:glutaredoxin 3
MIEIWGKPQCPYCTQATILCKEYGYDYIYKQLDEDFRREDVFEEFPNARTFPQIKIDGQRIGGYDQLVKWHKHYVNRFKS